MQRNPLLHNGNKLSGDDKLLKDPFTCLHYLPAKNRGRHHDLYIQVLRAESSTNSDEMSSSTPASFLAMQVYAPVSSKCTLLMWTSLPFALNNKAEHDARWGNFIPQFWLLFLIYQVIPIFQSWLDTLKPFVRFMSNFNESEYYNPAWVQQSRVLFLPCRVSCLDSLGVMSMPFFNQVSWGLGMPSAWQRRLAVTPGSLAWLSGYTWMTGGTETI